MDKATALIPEVQTLMNQYDYWEKDEAKAALAWRFGERFINEAYEWFDELEEVYNEVQLRRSSYWTTSGTTLNCSLRTTTDASTS